MHVDAGAFVFLGAHRGGHLFAGLADLTQTAEDDEPEFEYAHGSEFLFNAPPGEPPCNPGFASAVGSGVTISSYVVRVAPNNGATYELVDGNLAVLAPLQGGPGEWRWEVPKLGLYRVKRNNGDSKTIEVIGDQRVIDVQL